MVKIFDLYSKRLADQDRRPDDDVYQYESLSAPLRQQIWHILEDGFGKLDYYTGGAIKKNELWYNTWSALIREYGKDHLGYSKSNPKDDIQGFVKSAETIYVLDLLEIFCRVTEKHTGHLYDQDLDRRGISRNPEELIEELNYRLDRAGVGFEFSDGIILRKDNKLTHREIVKPALAFLAGAEFEGAQEEFLKAHSHLRDGEHKDAIAWAAKSLESTMKAICEKQGWEYNKGSRATDLIKVLRDNGLFGHEISRSLDQLLATLKSGLPKLRDEVAAHGQGSKKIDVQTSTATYALNLAASKISYLVSLQDN